MIKLEIFVPVRHLEQMCAVLRLAGAGAVGNYDSVLSYSPVKGRWRPLDGAQPYQGEIGQLCEADEYKLEVCCREEDMDQIIQAVKQAHPYEEPVINAIALL